MFKLEHPFKRTATANDFAEGDLRDNLMEYYGGTSLVKLQWDAIHHPGTVIGIFERDEDAMSDVVNINDLIRWVKENNGKYINNFKKYKFFEYSTILEKYVEATIGGKKIPILAEMDKDGTIDLKFPKVEFTMNAKHHTSFSIAFIYSDSDNEAFKLWTYSYDNFISLLNAMGYTLNKDLKTNIINRYKGYLKEVGNDCNKLDVIYETIPDFVMETISVRDKMKHLKILTECSMVNTGWIFGTGFSTNEEASIINIIKSTKKEQISELFEELREDNLMQKLCYRLDNWGGKDNYSTFIAHLLKLFVEENGSKLIEALSKVNLQDSKIYERVDFPWRKASTRSNYLALADIGYKKKYENNKLIFHRYPRGLTSNEKNRDYVTLHYDPLDPFDIVTVYFATEPIFISDNIPEGTVMAMPAFLFEWVCNEYNNKQIMKYVEGGIAITSLYFSVANISKLGAIFRTLTIIKATASAVDLALLDDSFKKYASSLGGRHLDVLAVWGIIGKTLVVENSFEELYLQNSISKFGVFSIAWNGFKQSPEYKELSGENKDIVETIDNILELLKEIE